MSRVILQNHESRHSAESGAHPDRGLGQASASRQEARAAPSGRHAPTSRPAASFPRPASRQICPARGRQRSERRRPPNWTLSDFATLGARDQAFALSLLAGRLAGSPDRLRFLAGLARRRLFVGLATLHLAKNTLALHPLLQNSQSLIDVVVANEYLQMFSNRAAAAVVVGRDVVRVVVSEP